MLFAHKDAGVATDSAYVVKQSELLCYGVVFLRNCCSSDPRGIGSGDSLRQPVICYSVRVVKYAVKVML